MTESGANNCEIQGRHVPVALGGIVRQVVANDEVAIGGHERRIGAAGRWNDQKGRAGVASQVDRGHRVEVILAFVGDAATSESTSSPNRSTS